MSEIVSTAPVETPPAADGTPVQKPEGEAPPATSEVAKPEVELTPDQVAKRNQNRLDRKIDKAYKRAAEAQARADHTERLLAEERAKNAPKAPDGAPNLEGCDFDPEKYAEAKAKFVLKQAQTEAVRKHQTESWAAEQKRLTTEWETKVERAHDKYDDFDAKVGDIKPNSPFYAAIMEAENGEDIAHYLGSNIKEAQRILQLSERAQVREIGKLEAKFLAKPPEIKTPPDVPDPIKPVGGSSAPSTKRLIDMTQAEFDKRRRQQIAERR
jgi:hypothetical protein